METTQLIDPAFWASAEPVAPGSVLPEGAHDPEGLIWFRTSGSTGTPKWCGLSRDALLLSAAVVNGHLEVGAEDGWGLVLPLHHVGGFGVVARAYEAGCRLACHRGAWNPADVVEWIRREQVTHLSLVPTQVHDLVSLKLEAPASLKAVVVGGGSMALELGKMARSLGWPVLASYGMTEAGSQIATQPLSSLSAEYSTSPLSLLPHWEAREGASGRLEVRGPALFRAKLVCDDGWNFQPRDGEWFQTEDVVAVRDGHLTFLGRNDRCVKVLGELVDLSSIERELNLKDAVVVALPDERLGHRLVLVHADGSVDSAIARYHETVEGPWRIHSATQVDELPRTELGKLMMEDLRRIARGDESA